MIFIIIAYNCNNEQRGLILIIKFGKVDISCHTLYSGYGIPEIKLSSQNINFSSLYERIHYSYHNCHNFVISFPKG